MKTRIPAHKKYWLLYQTAFRVYLLIVIASIFFVIGVLYSRSGQAQSENQEQRVVYKDKTELEFEGMGIEGEFKNPGEFYFEHQPKTEFDSLVDRRKKFHRQMLRDVIFNR